MEKGNCVFFTFFPVGIKCNQSLALEQSPPSLLWSIELLLCSLTYEESSLSRLQSVTITTVLLYQQILSAFCVPETVLSDSCEVTHLIGIKLYEGGWIIILI